MLSKNRVFHLVYGLVILIMAAVIVVLGVKLGSSGDEGLTEHEKYYKMKCESFAAQNFNLSKEQIIFIGDSITDLFPLDDYFADLDLACYNRGIGGDTTSGVLRRIEVSITELAPSKVVLLIGTNDINGGVEQDKIVANYREILATVRAALPDTEILLMSVIPQGDGLNGVAGIDVAANTARILALNEEIRAMSDSDDKIHYFDIFTLLADENNRLKKEYSDDALHLNAGGFEVWAGLIKPYLQ